MATWTGVASQPARSQSSVVERQILLFRGWSAISKVGALLCADRAVLEGSVRAGLLRCRASRCSQSLSLAHKTSATPHDTERFCTVSCPYFGSATACTDGNADSMRLVA